MRLPQLLLSLSLSLSLSLPLCLPPLSLCLSVCVRECMQAFVRVRACHARSCVHVRGHTSVWAFKVMNEEPDIIVLGVAMPVENMNADGMNPHLK